MKFPNPTPVFRFFHLDNLHLYLAREALHAPNMTPDDGRLYKTIHEVDIQFKRANTPIPCGPRGSIHDYVPFYFGSRAPMLLKISNHQTQNEIIYIGCYAQKIVESGCPIIFSDGHGIMRLTSWYDSLQDLEKLDWDAIGARYWEDTPEHPDRTRRKQAEFLVHKECPWALVKCIGVLNVEAQQRVLSIFDQYDARLSKEILIRPKWYYV